MAKKVCIIHNEDGEEWMRSLHNRLSNPQTVNASVFHHKDTALFSGKTDARSETRILNASVVVVLVTPGHIEFMISKKTATYDRICPNGDKGLLFFVGLTEDEITENEIIKDTKRIFPCFDCWPKVTYHDDESLMELQEKIAVIMERPDPIQSKFALFPSTVHCEEETKVVAIIDEAIPEKDQVRAVIRGTYTDEDILCERLNQHAYAFVMPSHVEDKATVYLSVNRRSLGSQAEIQFKSYISCSDQTAVSEIYCHMLDRLCFFVQTHCQTVCSIKDIDNALLDIFSHTIDLPAVGYEKLFGVYQYFTKEQSRTMVPTLVHLAANYNLQEMVGNLQDLPCFRNAICVTNKEMKRPTEIAEDHDHKDLADFLRDKEEEAECYIRLVYGEGFTAYYNKGYQNVNDKRHSEMIDYYSSVDTEGNYADMTGNQKKNARESYDYDIMERSQNEQPMTFDNVDLILLKEKLQRGELSLREAEGEFMKWQRKYMKNSLSFQDKKAMMKTVLEDLREIARSGKGPQQSLEYRQTDRESVPPPVPHRSVSRSSTERVFPQDAARTPDSHLGLKSKSKPESGELHDYFDNKVPLRRGTGSARSSRTSTSSGASSGRGSLTSLTDQDEFSRISNRPSAFDLDLPPPPPVPKKVPQSTIQSKKRR